MNIWHSYRNRQGQGHKNNSDIGKLLFLAAFIWIIPVTNPAETLPTIAQQAAASQEPVDNSLTSLMLANIALDRHQAHYAAEQFMELANTQKQPVFAERAMLAAIQSFDLTLAYQAANSWTSYAPNSQAARYFASLLAIQKNAPDAEQQLDKLFEDFPDQALQFSVQIQQNIVSDKAKQQWSELIVDLAKEHSEDTNLLFLAASEQFKQDQIKNALSSVDRLLTKDPDFTQAVILKTKILATQNSNQAMDYLTSEIAKKPNDSALLFTQANLYFQTHQSQKALEKVKQITEDYKNISDIKINASLLLIDNKTYAEARIYLQAVLNQDPKNSKARFLMGELSQKQNHNNEALDWFLSVEEGSEQYPVAMLKAAELLVTLKAPQDALQVLSRVTPLAPVAIEQWIKIRVDALILKKQYREAMKWVNQGLVIFPDSNVFVKMKTALAE